LLQAVVLADEGHARPEGLSILAMVECATEVATSDFTACHVPDRL
jgi:hypothetical protein